MNILRNSTVRVLLPIVIIIIGTTIGYQLIYAHNPFTQLLAIFSMTMNQEIGLGRPAPEFSGITRWLNTPDGAPRTMAELRGKVVLIDFWTYSCINCQRSVPHVVAWDEKYADQGLVTIGVHTPEFRFEEKVQNVEAAIQKFNIKYAVAMDNDYKTWRAFHTLYWPTIHLIDAAGNIVYTKIGEGAYDITEQKIVELLTQAKEMAAAQQ